MPMTLSLHRAQAVTTLQTEGAWAIKSLARPKAHDWLVQPKLHCLLTLRLWGKNEACLLIHSLIFCSVDHMHVKLLLVPSTALAIARTIK